jgi:sortase A
MVEASYFGKPGIHSYNRSRFEKAAPPKRTGLRFTRLLLLLLGIAGVGYYAFTLLDQYVYQVYGNWVFEQQIAGRPNVTFSDYLREQTPFGTFAGAKAAEGQPKPAAVTQEQPANGAVIGRVEVERLNISAIVRQGVDDKTLSEAVGHVPSTALPGQAGNFAIAAHRDTLFRGLKDIRKDDLIRFQSESGTFTYRVAGMKIVRPTDVSVLRPDGGGIIAEQPGSQPPKLLTMITCYPFYYVGSAPKRFIVEAELLK